MPDRSTARPRFCSQCGSPLIVPDAVFCKECGAPIPPPVTFAQSGTPRPQALLLLSLIPGLGHWYKGQRSRGLIWFFTVLFFYTQAPIFGLVMHVICAGNAAAPGGLLGDTLSGRNRGRSSRLTADAP